MYMILHDSHLDDPRAVSARLCRHELAQKSRDGLID
jgi:hypothetical protein